MKKIFLIGLIYILCFFTPEFALCQISITVAPPLVETDIPAGGFRTVRLVVSNLGDKSVDIEGYMSDLKLNQDGTPVVIQPGTSAYSCAEWLELTEDEFTLDAGSKKVIGLKINVPRGVRGGRYGVILFESVSSGRRRRGNVILGARLGTIVMISIPRTFKRGAEISRIWFERVTEDGSKGLYKGSSTKPFNFIVSLKNTGNIHIKAQGSLVIKNEDGRIVDRVPLESGTGTVLPEGVRDFEGFWYNPIKMKKGKYTAEARINYKGRSQARAERIFTIE